MRQWGALHVAAMPRHKVRMGSLPENGLIKHAGVSKPQVRQKKDDVYGAGSGGVLSCHFCMDYAPEASSLCCGGCGAIVCQQTTEGGTGCIAFQTATGDRNDFLCPICFARDRSAVRSLPYGFIGYGTRSVAKMAWPLLLVTIQLESLQDAFLHDLLKLVLNNEYSNCPENVSGIRPASDRMSDAPKFSPVSLLMKKGAQAYETKKLEPLVDFTEAAIQAGRPPNMIAIMDTHSDPLTGYLQHQGGVSGGQSTTVGDIVRSYITPPLLLAMERASKISRNHPPDGKTRNGNSPWKGMVAKSRGGWRGLIMVTCGPAIRSPAHFAAVQELVRG